MKSRVRILRNATLILLGSAVVAACSDSGTVTTLPARPKVDIGLPQELLNASAVVKTNLRPEIRFDNGSAVTLTRGEGNNWSGTINVTPGRTYQTTLTWLERVNQRDIALARLTQTLDVSADGTITGSQSSGYTTDIDTDNDGRSNLQERQDGTDPLIPGNGTDTGTGTDSGTGTGTDTGTDAGTDTGTDSGTDTGTGTGTDTGTGSGTDSGTGSGTDTGTDSGTDTGADSGTDTGADSGTDTGTDSGTDTGTDTGTDSGTDTGTDSGTGSGTDTGTDTNPPPVIADVIVPRIASSDAPVIDGKGLESLGSNGELIGEWAAAVQTDNSGAPLLIDQLIINNSTNESTGSDRRRWAAMHDGTYLYVLVLVDDDGDRNRDSGNNINQDDSLELFLDGDNSKSSRYDINDFSRLFPLQLPGADKQPTSSGAVAGVQSSSAPLSITFTTGPGIGPDGTVRRQYEQDVYELRIGLSSAGIDPDSPFGFELHVNDDDGGGNRNARWAWKLRAGSADIANQSPSVFGTLMLD